MALLAFVIMNVG